MIIHSYLTNGFFPWAKIFLESYKFHNGSKNLIIFSTRGLNNNQISVLYDLYDNLVVKNEDYDLKGMAIKAGVSEKILRRYKKQVETKCVTLKNRVWKLMIAADDRVKSTYDVMREYIDEDFMFHSDIDMYIRSPLDELFDKIKQHDISIKLRLNSKLNRKTMIGIQGYRLCKNTLRFMERWIKYIDDVKPKDRPLGYGQTSCYYAYEDFKNRVSWWSLPRRFIAPQMYDTDIIWSGNTKKGKTKNLKICYEDFEGMKNGNKADNTV